MKLFSLQKRQHEFPCEGQGFQFFSQYPADSPPHHSSGLAAPPPAATAFPPTGLPSQQHPAEAQVPNFHTQVPLSQDAGLPIGPEGLVPQSGRAGGPGGPGPSQSPFQWTRGAGGGGSTAVPGDPLTQVPWSQEVAYQVGSPPVRRFVCRLPLLMPYYALLTPSEAGVYMGNGVLYMLWGLVSRSQAGGIDLRGTCSGLLS